MENKKETCDFCNGVIDKLALSFKGTRVVALTKAVSQFEKYHENSTCIDNYCCLPLMRANIELQNEGKK